MRKRIPWLVGRGIVAVLGVVFFVGIAAHPVAASEPSADKPLPKTESGASEVARAPSALEADNVQRTGSIPPKIDYVLYNDALRLQPEPPISRAESLAVNVAESATSSKAMPAPAPAPRASTAPMTPGEKFTRYAKGTFLSPGAYGQSIFAGLFNELRDKKDKPDFDTGDFFGDAMTRAARSYAFRATSGFLEKFALASILRQDPRYHRSDRTGAGAKLAYAVSRLFVTQGDRSGDQINASFLLGAAGASAIANVWEREERRDFRHSATRFGVHLGLTALSNIFREFVGGQ
ncbi:MAG TPA: hypothetical protein VGV87_08065 [Blastocatellia bacterium]|nr:hypothetical protein [Blastocatellia bacterium]